MKLVTIAVCLCVFMETSYARLSKDSLRQALSVDPVFSHQRDSAVPIPQNVNVDLPFEASAVQTRANTRPTALGGRVGGTQRAVNQNRHVQPVAAGKPVRQQEMILGQVKPTKISQPQPAPVPSRPVARSQNVAASKPRRNQASGRKSNSKPRQAAAASKPECSFHIPSFLLPDPDPSSMGPSIKCPSFLLPGPNINPELVNLMVEHWTGISTNSASSSSLNGVKSQITQVEFEQKCLIPALRAHVLGGPACKTRELKVYLEWLLYLRQRLFNI